MTNPPFLSKCIFILPLLQSLMFNTKWHLLLQQAQSPSVAGLRVLSCALSPAVISIPNLPWGHHCRCDRSSHKTSCQLPTPEYCPCLCLPDLHIQSYSGKHWGWLCSLCLGRCRVVASSWGVASWVFPWTWVSLHNFCKRISKFIYLVMRAFFSCDFCAFALAINKQRLGLTVPVPVLCAAWWM